jgi:hypothetical protein
MRLSEIKVLREDSTPATDAANSFKGHWDAGWSDVKKADDKAGAKDATVDESMEPIIAQIVGGYPATSTLDHAKLTKMMPDDEARATVKKNMDAIPAIIIGMADKYMANLRGLADHGLRARVQAARGGKPVEDWLKELRLDLLAQLDRRSAVFTTDHEKLKRLSVVFADQQYRKMMSAALMSSKGATDIADKASIKIEPAIRKPLGSKNAVDEADRTINTLEAFIGYCRALLENQNATARQIGPFLDQKS